MNNHNQPHHSHHLPKGIEHKNPITQDNKEKTEGKVIYHEDGRKTVTETDLETKTVTVSHFDANGNFINSTVKFRKHQDTTPQAQQKETEQQTMTNTPLPTESAQTEKPTSKEPDGKLDIKITDKSGNADGEEGQLASLVAALEQNSETAVVSNDGQQGKMLQIKENLEIP